MSARASDDDDAVCARLFWGWLLLRTLVWLAVILATQPNPTLDLIEWSSWSHTFEWGYNKHPPFAAWILRVFVWISPNEVWAGYLGGYALASVCLWSAWKMGREFLSPQAALAAAMCLDGLIFVTLHAADYNNNIALAATWALTALCFVKAVRTDSLAWWLALGVAAGIGILTKYTLVTLLAALGGYLVVEPTARRHWRRAGPYLAMLVAAAVIAPHVVWLANNDFHTISYARQRTTEKHHWFHHLAHPVEFAVEQPLLLLPAILILAPMLRWPDSYRWSQGNVRLLTWLVIGPAAVHLLVSLATGCKLRIIYAAPLWTFAGVWLLAVAGSPEFAWRRAVRSWAVVAGLMAIVCAGKNITYPYLTHRQTRVQFPGRQLAEEVERRWHERRPEAMPIVAGDGWRAGNVVCHLQNRPLLFSSGIMGTLHFDPKLTPWTNDADLIARGGAIVWDIREDGKTLPTDIRERFPMAELQAPIRLEYQTGASVMPEYIGIAFVWPTDDAPRMSRR